MCPYLGRVNAISKYRNSSLKRSGVRERFQIRKKKARPKINAPAKKRVLLEIPELVIRTPPL